MNNKSWIKNSFADFQKGEMGNGGQNIYVSAKGVLQRIFQYDTNGTGYPDLVFANSHAMDECPPLHMYSNPLSDEEPKILRSPGAFDACLADITGDGYEDLIIAAQHNGVHPDIPSLIYYSSEEGYTEKYMQEIPTVGAISVAAGDIKGRGKNDLAFVGGGMLRVFYQTDLGIEVSKFTDYDINAISVSCADIDGDGYADLYLLMESGKMRIYWGSEDGINADNYTELSETEYVNDEIDTTTLGRLSLRRLPWCTQVINFKGKNCIFRADKGDAVLDSFNEKRERTTQLRIPAGGAVHMASGDLTGDGKDDIVILVQTDRDKIENSLVLLAKDNYDYKKAIILKTRAARTASIAPIDHGSKKYVFIAQTSTRKMHSTDNIIYGLDADGNIDFTKTIPGDCSSRLCVARSGIDDKNQLVLINHEGNRVLGLEDSYIYLGDKDGYSADRRLELPGCAPTDAVMADFFDTGSVDVLFANCSENAPHLCPGLRIFTGKDGLKRDKYMDLPAILPWGVAVGDFRKSGYLDIVCGGIKTRELRIFEGGPDGYSADRMKKIVFGPEADTFVPFPWDIEDKDPDYSPEENERIADYGNPRWLYAADFNGDGYLDLFVSQISGKNCMILWGGPDGFSTENMQILASDGISCANAADFNNNGYLDLVLGGHFSMGKNEKRESYITIYWGSKDGYKENRKTQLPIWCNSSITIGDFNNDGILDIYASSYSNSRIRDLDSFIYFGDKDGTFSPDRCQRIFNFSGSGCMSGDLNGNGYTDLVVASHKHFGHHECDSFVYWGGPDGIREDRYTALPTIGTHGMISVDMGNIMDRSDNEYYYSEIYKAPSAVDTVSWTGTVPKSCKVHMELRCADTVDEVKNAPWRCIAENGENVSKHSIEGFIQYRLVLSARCGCGTPRIDGVTVTFK